MRKNSSGNFILVWAYLMFLSFLVAPVVAAWLRSKL